MKVIERLKGYLNKNNINYVLYYHNRTDKKVELANNLGFLEKEFVQTFIVKTKDGYAMTVLPDGQGIDINLFKDSGFKTKAKLVRLDEVKTLFPDCELGAIPPLGNIYKFPVYIPKALKNFNEIVFHAGTHTDTIKMRYEDFYRLVKPKVFAISNQINFSN